MTEIEKQLRALARTVKALEAVPVEVPDIPDAAGTVRAIEIRLQALRKGWNELAVAEARDPESEYGPETLGSQEAERGQFGGVVRPKVTGKQYRTVVKSGPTKRTYNTGAILNGIANSDQVDVDSPLDALMWAVGEKIAEIKWRWSPLKKAAESLGLPVRVVKYEIADDGDLDGPWIGAVTSETITQEPITPKDQA